MSAAAVSELEITAGEVEAEGAGEIVGASAAVVASKVLLLGLGGRARGGRDGSAGKPGGGRLELAGEVSGDC